MSVSITIVETRTIAPGNLYQVEDEITAATDISTSIFVFVTETQAFDHVATVWDMENVDDESYAAAVEHDAAFYRLDIVTRAFHQQSHALDFATYTQERVAWLADEYETATTDFVDTTTHTYPETP